jgi:CheY-like chemotaxis protein
VLVGVRVRGAEAEIRVEDQGRGIPEAALENVFGKFQQVDASDSREKGGTGLGLAICQAIIQQHEGRLWVESEEGVGSAFFFTLPRAAPATESTAARTAPEPRPTSGPRVLVCDDDRDYVRMMELFLERAGFGVIPTYSGEEALETLASTEVLAVLLDVGLPRMSGLDVLREIKGRPETASLPVIIVSGRSPSELGEAPTPLVLDWLTKPINEPRLLARLRETLHAGSSPTVLLVDDDEELLTLLSGLLTREHAGIRVLTATTGKEAIALCRRETPGIMVLDIAMPEGDGFSVIDAMREDPALRKMPVVVYSGMEPSPEERRRLTLGTTRFLTKSKAKEDDFVAQVVELLNGILPTRDMDLNGG